MFKFIHKQKHKNNKLLYYIKSFVQYYTPKRFCQKRLPQILEQLNGEEKGYIMQRVNYYCKLEHEQSIETKDSVCLRNFKLPKKKKGQYANRTYFFDTYEYTRYFDNVLRINTLFGDITEIPSIPSITKSRPINGENSNSILLNLDKVRHFTFVNDNRKFTDKKDMLIGRAYVRQPHRIRFWEMYFEHPMCDLGQINTNYIHRPEWIVKPISIDEHLDYKFILCIEGNDVASNLKWVMSSNSLAVMPRPKYETWYMEGTLKPDYHYVCIKDDYSDLEKKLTYYIQHPEEAQRIINQAHEYVAQFRDKKREDLISLMVLDKYFKKTCQYDNH
ncbi:MAG: glycosyltransferase [Bacteroidaceae bacterium]|nr:glycosyltransferase [Bacteroidaceae bacterium]